MTLLILGVALWWLAHLFKRLAPGLRAPMGDAGKGAVALALLVSLVLMVVGYRQTPVAADLVSFPGNGHLNNTLMLIALIVFGAGMAKGALWTKIRHPMLWGTVLWALAHLVVHNDLASLILFGGIGAWALVAMAAVNAAGPWVRPVSGGAKRDFVEIVIAVVMYGAIVGIHMALGMNPFLGTYG